MDGMTGNPDATMRIIRACEGFAIGTAMRDGHVTGFLLNTHRLHTIPLIQTMPSGDVHHLKYPRAMLLRADGRITVVGQGVCGDSTFPAIAHVLEDTVTVLLGNGLDDSSETYFDVLEDACRSDTLCICGESGGGVATVHVVDGCTGVVKKTALLSATTVGSSEATTVAVSMTATHECMLVVGVHVGNAGDDESSSLLWPLDLHTLTQLLPLSVTSFNDPSTNRLRLPMHTHGSTIIKVLGGRRGEALHVVSMVTFRATTPCVNVPLHALVVQKFTRDTDPDVAYGASGFVTWYDAHAMSTRPTDAVLHGGTVYVTGNVFASETATAATYITPALPFLNVHADPTSAPAPFVLQVRPGGSASCLLNSLGGGCAEATFANAIVVTPAVITVLGDVWFHLRCPAQPAGLLLVTLGMVGSCPRVLNGGKVNIPIIRVNSPTVVVDALCDGPTTLQIAGPLVVGCVASGDTAASCLPGTIVFDPVLKTFKGFDGDAWKSFTQ
jgi:hypothetical protein